MKLKILTVATVVTLALGIGPPTSANQSEALVEQLSGECSVRVGTRLATRSCEEGVLQTKFSGDVVYQVTAPVNVDPTPDGALDLEVKRVRHAPGMDDVLGLLWKDLTAWKRGVQWRYDPRITLRAEVVDSNQAVPSSEELFNITGSGVPTAHYTVGMIYRLSDHSEIRGSFVHAPRQRALGINPNTGPQAGFIQMGQNEFELTYTRYLR